MQLLDISEYIEDIKPELVLFMQAGEMSARMSFQVQSAPFGPHGAFCECDINKTLMVVCVPNGQIGLGVHRDSDPDQAWAFMRECLGERLTEKILDDPDNDQYGYHSEYGKNARTRPVAASTPLPGWLDLLNTDLLEED